MEGVPQGPVLFGKLGHQQNCVAVAGFIHRSKVHLLKRYTASVKMHRLCHDLVCIPFQGQKEEEQIPKMKKIINFTFIRLHYILHK